MAAPYFERCCGNQPNSTGASHCHTAGDMNLVAVGVLLPESRVLGLTVWGLELGASMIKTPLVLMAGVTCHGRCEAADW